MAPADAFDRMPSWVTLVCFGSVDSGANVLELILHRHADRHRAVFDQLGLDLSCSLQIDLSRVSIAALAPTTHFL